MSWEVVYTDQFGAWWETLTDEQQDQIIAAVQVLEDQGPALGRPLVDRIAGSKLSNLKELRVSKGGALRILFIFDLNRRAVLLIGGDKSGRWVDWYPQFIPEAERLYEVYLTEVREEWFK